MEDEDAPLPVSDQPPSCLRNQKLCLLYEIDGNVCLHKEGIVLETGLSKKLRLDASKNRGLGPACLENPAWDNGIPILGGSIWGIRAHKHCPSIV